ncbi:MAG: DivIVA domain-containing protein [Actinomycetota bacterium]|nr:DivIVA domain-containing protein [Actinomycetota bacterium]
MTIKPLDIRRKEFKNSLRGYDQNQVDDFLDSIADEFEKVFSENQRMKDQVSTLRERLEQFDDLEGSIRAALVHAEQAASNLRQSSARDAENVRQNAQRDAELTIREAKSHAHQILADSSSRVERVQESYQALREARGTFAADFRHLLSTYMSVMENMDVATAKEIEASLRVRLDPESIAVAREAAAAEEETRIQPPLSASEPTTQEPEVAETSTFEDTASDEEAPAFETSRDSAESEEYDPAQDPNATQRMMPPTTEPSSEQSEYEVEEPEVEEPEVEEPEVEEPEVEPSSVPESASDEAGPSGTAEPEREEPAASDASGETSEDAETSEDDTEERTLASESASEGFFEERQETNDRSWRAGRFLRRRG